MADTCTHLDQIKIDLADYDLDMKHNVCEDCVKLGSSWVHLRVCLICGYIGCCDSSINHHATRHFHQTGHPLIVMMEEGPDLVYCYADDMLIDLAEADGDED